jgi:hypothetical protein
LLIARLFIVASSATSAVAANFSPELHRKSTRDDLNSKCADVEVTGLVINEQTPIYAS